MGNVTLGSKVKDQVSGFTGIVVGHIEYLGGRCQSQVQPEVGKDGKLPASEWIEDGRLQVVVGKASAR